MQDILLRCDFACYMRDSRCCPYLLQCLHDENVSTCNCWNIMGRTQYRNCCDSSSKLSSVLIINDIIVP